MSDEPMKYGEHPAYTAPTDLEGLRDAFPAPVSECHDTVICGGARWFDSLGREVDLNDIDKEYALAILTMVLLRYGRASYTSDEVREDPLVQKLRDVVLNGREPNERDRARARVYNIRNERQGKPFRAPVG